MFFRLQPVPPHFRIPPIYSILSMLCRGCDLLDVYCTNETGDAAQLALVAATESPSSALCLQSIWVSLNDFDYEKPNRGQERLKAHPVWKHQPVPFQNHLCRNPRIFHTASLRPHFLTEWRQLRRKIDYWLFMVSLTIGHRNGVRVPSIRA